MTESRHEPMQLVGKAKKVTIFVGQSPGQRGKQNYLRILEHLKTEGAAGATAFKAMASFGARAHVHTVRLADVNPDLPVMIVWIDTADQVERILPHLWDMVPEGLIAIEDTEVLLHTTTALPDLPARTRVEEIMTRNVVSVYPETPLTELVQDLVRRRFRAVPVVDGERKVVGIVTSGDLVRRGLSVRPELLRTYSPTELQEALAKVSGLTTRDVMTSSVVTVRPQARAREAADLMHRHTLRRLLVVDASGHLVGLVSRVDLLRAVAPVPESPQPLHRRSIHVQETDPVHTLMSTEVPTVAPETPISEVVQIVLAGSFKRAVVVDAHRHVLGIVRDVELADYVTPEDHPGIVDDFARHIPFLHTGSKPKGPGDRRSGGRAGDVMLTDVVIAHPDDPARDVLAAMVQKGRTIALITDEADELIGAVSRADLLDALVEG